MPAGPPGRVGALLLAGHRDDGALELAGQVGTGFSAVMRRHLFEVLHPLVREVPPVVNPPVGEQGLAMGRAPARGRGRVSRVGAWAGLRHASWKGLREQVDVRTIRLPPVI